MRQLAGMASRRYGAGFTTDNGNVIIDVHDLRSTTHVRSSTIDSIVGVVTNGLFAARGADILLLGTARWVLNPTATDTT